MSELDPLLLRAFAEARAERPHSGEGKARTLAAVGLAGTAPSATSQRLSGAAAGAAGRTSRLLTWPWWIAGVALLATLGESFHAPETLGSTSTAVSIPADRPSDAPAAALVDIATDVATAPTISVDELPNAAAKRHLERAGTPVASAPCASCKAAATVAPVAERAPAPSARPRARPAESASLRDEIEAIERASRALSQRRCALARQHLAEYGAKFPDGRLQREAEVVSIEIAARSGKTQRARAAARAFVERFPDSPYALRLAPWLRDDADEIGAVTCADAAE